MTLVDPGTTEASATEINFQCSLTSIVNGADRSPEELDDISHHPTENTESRIATPGHTTQNTTGVHPHAPHPCPGTERHP